MTHSPGDDRVTSRPAPAGDDDLFPELVRVIKLLQAAKTRLPSVHPHLDSAAYPLLFTLQRWPMRVSQLAELIRSDTSTVSRQASHLVAAGLVGKVADPDDGRAQLLALTERGEDVVNRVRVGRAEWMRDLLQSWSAEDIAAFGTGLRRFGDTLEDWDGPEDPDHPGR